MPINNSQKALIHVAKTKMGLSDDEYRDILKSFGVASSRELTCGKFERVMDHFEKLGFESPKRADRKAKARVKPVSSKELLTKKVKALAHDLGLTRSYIDAMSRHMFDVSSWSWLDAHQLGKLVAALCYHQKRKSAKSAQANPDQAAMI